MNSPMSGIRLQASTYRFEQLDVLLERASADDPLVWSRGNDMLVGVGETLRLTFDGPSRISDAAEAWERLKSTAEVDDPIGIPSTGLLAFGSFTFSPESGQSSVLRVPRFVFGRRGDTRFVTEIRLSGEPSEPIPTPRTIDHSGSVSWNPVTDANAHQAAVRGALSYIAAGSVQKVVLARSITGAISEQFDYRSVVADLQQRFGDTWVFAIDGLIGASPETLVAIESGIARLKVLAGTLAREAGDASTLIESEKDQAEHRYAIESVTESLRLAGIERHDVSDTYALELPDLWHLASDVAFAAENSNVLTLVDALHPTAAVAGTPTEAALKVISKFETIDRGRYAGPVGWVDAHGNGEWAIALRCAQFAGNSVTASAGGGIVAGSDPALEFAETEVKLRAIRSAL